MRAYYYEIWKTFAADFRALWTAHKIISTVPGPLIGFAISAIFKRPTNGGGLMQAFIASIVGFLCVTGLTAIVSAIKAPKLLDDRRQQQIRDLTKPLRTSVEERRFQIVKNAIERLGGDAMAPLRHLRTFGKIVFEHSGTLLPEGMQSDRVKELLAGLKAVGIVESERIPIEGMYDSVGPLHQMLGYRVSWTITPLMESAVDEFL